MAAFLTLDANIHCWVTVKARAYDQLGVGDPAIELAYPWASAGALLNLAAEVTGQRNLSLTLPNGPSSAAMRAGLQHTGPPRVWRPGSGLASKQKICAKMSPYERMTSPGLG
jgi:hypothetical protein